MDTDATPSTDLRGSIEWIRHHGRELRLCNVDPTDAICEDLRTFFEIPNVRITVGETASGAPEAVAVLSSETEVPAVVDVATLEKLLEDAPTGADELGIADGKYEDVLRYLKETTLLARESDENAFDGILTYDRDSSITSSPT